MPVTFAAAKLTPLRLASGARPGMGRGNPDAKKTPAAAAPAGPPPTMAASSTVPVGPRIVPSGLVVKEFDNRDRFILYGNDPFHLDDGEFRRDVAR